MTLVGGEQVLRVYYEHMFDYNNSTQTFSEDRCGQLVEGVGAFENRFHRVHVRFMYEEPARLASITRTAHQLARVSPAPALG
jgi:hypothetical protein